jgi:hypothetical protein
MRILFATGMACVACALVQCKPREFNNDSGVKNADPAVCPPQVNPNAFNAYNMWLDGSCDPVLNPPQDYENITSQEDGVFYESGKAYSSMKNNQQPILIGVPTAGAAVEGDLLVYPARGKRTLKLRFAPPSATKNSQSDAVKHCSEKGLRLPTIRELFDFCVADTPKSADGSYPKNRCGSSLLSASVFSHSRSNAWIFDSSSGHVSNVAIRFDPHGVGVRCVGGK